MNQKFQMNIPYEEGDIFVLDNIMTAHGRTPFQGARKIGVMLGDEIDRNDFEKKQANGHKWSFQFKILLSVDKMSSRTHPIVIKKLMNLL